MRGVGYLDQWFVHGTKAVRVGDGVRTAPVNSCFHGNLRTCKLATFERSPAIHFHPSPSSICHQAGVHQDCRQFKDALPKQTGTRSCDLGRLSPTQHFRLSGISDFPPFITPPSRNCTQTINQKSCQITFDQNTTKHHKSGTSICFSYFSSSLTSAQFSLLSKPSSITLQSSLATLTSFPHILQDGSVWTEERQGG